MTATRTTRATGAALAAAFALALVPAPAGADGDPASDVLLTTDAFYPYRPVSTKLVHALDTTISRARTAGYPIKVALIGQRSDLGAAPGLYGHPQQYANFLESEISFNGHPRLLVVMPQGLGLAAAGSRHALAGIGMERGGSDGLARTAIRAVAALARDAGHPFKLPAIPAGAGSRGGGGSTLLAFAAPLAAVALLAVASLLRRRRAPPGPE